MPLATNNEALAEFADNAGMDRPDQEWLLSSWDTWERNPHYCGEPGRHPEDDSELNYEPLAIDQDKRHQEILSSTIRIAGIANRCAQNARQSVNYTEADRGVNFHYLADLITEQGWQRYERSTWGRGWRPTPVTAPEVKNDDEEWPF